MNNNKRMILSIITATYNRREKLERNIKSVISQSLKDIEHIIVDNLSNDGTQDLVEKYISQVKYPVVYIREKDKGVYEAINKGIKAAKGEWIHTLHSDDYYHNKNSLYKIFKEKLDGYNLLASSIIRKSGTKDWIWNPIYDMKLGHYNFPHTGTIIKKEFYNKYGFYNDKYKIISDAIHQIETYSFAKYKIINNPLVVMDTGGSSSDMDFTHLKERFILIFNFHKFPLHKKWRFFISDLYKFITNPSKNDC